MAYEDANTAIDWLSRAFGFREEKDQRIQERDGRVSHAELRLGAGRVYLSTPTPDYQGPKHHRETCAAASKWSSVPWVIDGLLVHVDDVDRHFATAKAAGATMLSKVEDAPYGRLYRAEDLEGHRWMFIQPP
ncbi:MAG: VOC family protein [Thermoplasmata archaeon]|nr:VOC family protein [Thermoplasmata archaeon]